MAYNRVYIITMHDEQTDRVRRNGTRRLVENAQRACSSGDAVMSLFVGEIRVPPSALGRMFPAGILAAGI